MDIIVNGKNQTIAAGTTVAALLVALELDPERVAVEVNLEIVSKDQFNEKLLTAGDTLEIVQFVGGG